MEAFKLVEEHFPPRFEFFGMGHVEAIPTACRISDVGRCGLILLFKVGGDELGYCAVGFEGHAERHQDDESMLVEIANILVAKFANQLADATGAMIEISPPRTPDRRFVHALRNAPQDAHPNVICHSYEFRGAGKRIAIRLAFLPERHGIS